MSLTIKQAFEALSDACGAGMKNPFFVMRRLKESFADVASKVVDASGDKVTVTQTLTEGTEIGSIKVNNATTVLYAPAGGSQNYSTTEHIVGKWIDNSDIYEITITGLTLTLQNNAWVYYAGIEGINEVIGMDVYAIVAGRYVKIENCEYTREEASPYRLMVQATSLSVGREINVMTVRYTKSAT